MKYNTHWTYGDFCEEWHAIPEDDKSHSISRGCKCNPLLKEESLGYAGKAEIYKHNVILELLGDE